MSVFQVTIEKRGYNAGTDEYRIEEDHREGASIRAAITALETYRRHGHTYPADAPLTITVSEADINAE